jgi:GATA-binding protein
LDLPLPTSASVHVPPGSFPNTAFTFSVPGTYEAFFDINAASATTPTAPPTAVSSGDFDQASGDMGQAYLQALQNMFNQGSVDEATRALLGSNMGDPMEPLTSLAAIQAGILQPENAFDFQQLMQQYLHTNATANPFTHINPTQVLGANFNNAVSHPLAASGTLSNFSSPTGMSPSVHAPQPFQNPGPTKPLPKAVGGKSIPPHPKPQPVRSNSSPNLVALKLGAMGSGIRGAEGLQSTNGSTDKGSANVKAGFKSGPSTPSSEDAGGLALSSSETPTHCSNCQTTNTPLWRRDPEGQPLCNVSPNFLSLLNFVADHVSIGIVGLRPVLRMYRDVEVPSLRV